jgi:hypothetical protein
VSLSDAVAMREPSGLKAADVTSVVKPSVSPRRTAISLMVVASQIRAVLSSDDDAGPVQAEDGGKHTVVMAAREELEQIPGSR